VGAAEPDHHPRRVSQFPHGQGDARLADTAAHDGEVGVAAGDSVSCSRMLAESLLAELGARWLHVQRVGASADQMVGRLGLGADADVVRSAAWLHDVGYAPSLVQSGFHPLDGARFLRSRGAPELLVSLVAHHTGAEFEATGRGLGTELAVFEPPQQELLDVVTFADLTSGPDGAEVTVDERLREILRRYPDDHVVHEAIERSSPSLRAVAARMQTRLARACG